MTIDHIKPKAKGGTDADKNLATCCLRCNKKKGCKTWDTKFLGIEFERDKTPGL
jgi:5-methylcytosine-specific restriction endonuclease McrA